MKRKTLYLLLLLFLLPTNFSQMIEEIRNNLLNKYAKPINTENFEPLKYNLKMGTDSTPEIKYKIKKNKEILEKYKFPENYNFIEETNATVHIKNQASCECCWSFGSTTALSYRFHKLGIDVDLSPQYPLSCVVKVAQREILEWTLL